MMGKMAVNDLSKSSFAGVTAQLQVYGQVGMQHGAAAVSDIERNHFLDRGTATKKKKAAAARGLFHDFCEELQLTAIMVAMQDAPRTRTLNDDAITKPPPPNRLPGVVYA